MMENDSNTPPGNSAPTPMFKSPFRDELVNYFKDRSPFCSTNEIRKLIDKYEMITHPLAHYLCLKLEVLKTFVNRTVHESLDYFTTQDRVDVKIRQFESILNLIQEFQTISNSKSVELESGKVAIGESEIAVLNDAIIYMKGIMSTRLKEFSGNEFLHNGLLTALPALNSLPPAPDLQDDFDILTGVGVKF